MSMLCCGGVCCNMTHERFDFLRDLCVCQGNAQRQADGQRERHFLPELADLRERLTSRQTGPDARGQLY
jgi:hypothetical protein